MKIGLLSDIHLEFGPYNGPWPEGDVLILSGDILVAAHLAAHKIANTLNTDARNRVSSVVASYDAFLDQAFKHYRHVLYIMGNHEHYGSDVAHTINLIEDRWGKQYPNLHVLEKQAIILDDEVLFFGATLWTNFNNRDPRTMSNAWVSMNDYNQIWINDGGETRQIRPAEVYEDHLEAVDALQQAVACAKRNNVKMVVLTHHAPSQRSCHPRYVGQYEMNGCYNSNLEHLCGGPIVLWTHGHTHDSYDYTVRGTRVLCNPRGYVGHALNPKFNPMLVVEV